MMEEEQRSDAACPASDAAAVSTESDAVKSEFVVPCLSSEIETLGGADSLPESSPVLAVQTLDGSSPPPVENAKTLTDKVLAPSVTIQDLQTLEEKSLAEPLIDANDGRCADVVPVMILPPPVGKVLPFPFWPVVGEEGFEPPTPVFTSSMLTDLGQESDGSSSPSGSRHGDDGDDDVDSLECDFDHPCRYGRPDIECKHHFNVCTREHHDHMHRGPRDFWRCQQCRYWPSNKMYLSGYPSQENADGVRVTRWEHTRERREDGFYGFEDPLLEDGPTGLGAGLSNLGNTCFVNAILQCFTHTVQFLKALRSCSHAMPCASSEFCVLCAIREHIELSLASSGRVISPSKLVDNLDYFSPLFRRYQQEDAHEFLHSLLDRLERCCLDSSPRDESSHTQEENFVQHVFGGRLVSKLQCCHCGHHSDTYEPLIDLSLEMSEEADTLQSVLESFTKVEKIEPSTCENCKEKVPKTKQLMLDQVPSVFTLHLKRFKTDGVTVEKIGKHVDFPLELDFKPYASERECSDGDLKYQLYAIVVHNGYSPTSGHYFCYIRSSPDTWHKLDDSRVIKFGTEFVLSQRAYILFYTREGTPWFSSLIEPPKPCSEPHISNDSPNKSVLDNVDSEHTSCPIAAKIGDCEPSVSSVAAEGTSPLLVPESMMEEVQVTGSRDEVESIQAEISAQSFSDVHMVDVEGLCVMPSVKENNSNHTTDAIGSDRPLGDGAEVSQSEELCSLPFVTESDSSHGADIIGTDGLPPATPYRSPSPESNLLPAKHDNPRGHLIMVSQVSHRRSLRVNKNKACKEEAIRQVRNVPLASRRTQLMASLLRSPCKKGVRSPCKKGSPPGSRRRPVRHLGVSR